jgi:GH24 family phage-related lysozyme (muramidase)
MRKKIIQLTESDLRELVRKIMVEVESPTDVEEISDPVIDSIRDRVIDHEGKRNTVYKDSRGIPTIGVGFNLNRQDSNTLLTQVGANPGQIKRGQSKLSNKQINTLLNKDLKKSKEDAKQLVKNFTGLPSEIQGVLIEMVFNLGKFGLAKFKKFLDYINKKNWKKASIEMLNSDWAKQVGRRSKTLSNIISSQGSYGDLSNAKNVYDKLNQTDVFMGKQFDKNTGLKIN